MRGRRGMRRRLRSKVVERRREGCNIPKTMDMENDIGVWVSSCLVESSSKCGDVLLLDHMGMY